MNSVRRKIGPYELLSRCGEGGFGEVWLARGLDGKLVALKMIGTAFRGKSWESELKGVRFYQQKVPHHPNLLEIFHVAQEEDFLYYTMEAADSASQEPYKPLTLAEKMKDGPLPTAELKTLLLDLGNGLDALHHAGLVHRDIKPENILYVNGIPKLADISLVRDPALTVSRSGTPGFCPPERDGQGSQADDCYALCMVGYCAATGLSPADFPRKPSELSLKDYAEVREIFIRGCHSEATKRFHSTNELRNFLQNGIRPTHKKFPIILLVVLALLLLSLGFFLLRKNKAPILVAKPQALPQEMVPHSVDVPTLIRQAQAQADDARKRAEMVAVQGQQQATEGQARLAALRTRQDQQLTELIQNARSIYQSSLASEEETLQNAQQKGALSPVQKEQLEMSCNKYRKKIRQIDEILPLPFVERQRAWKKFRDQKPE